MRTFWGLMRAYWFSDRWKEAWSITLLIAVLIAAESKVGVWFAKASAELVSAIAFFHDPRNPDPAPLLFTSAITLIVLVIFKEIVFAGFKHLVSSTLHRRWRAWLDRQFNDALLDRNHTHLHLQHQGRDGSGAQRPAPDNVDQRIQEAIKGMTGGAIGLAMGIFSVCSSLYFYGGELIATSTVVPGLEQFGIYGTAVLAFAAVALYVPINTWLAVNLGRILQRLNIRMQQAEASYRGELTVLLRNSFTVAASGGERAQRKMHGELYSGIDHTWGRLNIINSIYGPYEKIYNFVAQRAVAYAPGLLSYMNGSIGLKSYITGAELVNQLISQCSWFIHVMPEIATLRANARRVTDLANAIEAVQQPTEFYKQTGRNDFRFSTQKSAFGVTVRSLELLHEGETGVAFLKAKNLGFGRGEWVCLMGPSGSGKTSLMKAINGLWPHGAGDIVLPEGVRSFYAPQDVKLPRLSLKRLVCLPDTDELHTDVRVASALHKAGLGEFIEFLDSTHRDGKAWEDVLSGGQKQKLVLARILLHAPGLLFLDEATSALDPASKTAFHQAIKDECPNTTIVSIMHEPQPPRAVDGSEFYHAVVRFADGVATKMPLPKRAPTELKVVGEKKKPRADNGNFSI
jgi:ABC-type uncharacterized transport system fused permease/ATPase subunit